MKKTILTLVGIAVAATVLFANGPNTLTVKVKNLKNTDGRLEVSLFSSEADWLNKGAQKIVAFEDTDEVVVTFEDVTPGIYAVSVIHDENSNGDLDTGFLGIPTEDYGFSNDAKGTFGPASFGDSKFEMSADKKIVININ